MTYSKVRSCLSSLLTLALWASCSSTPGTGGVRQACFSNGTCNKGLLCLSNVCVVPPDGGAGATGTGGTGGGSGATGTGGTGGGSGATGMAGAAAGMSGGDAAAGMSGGDAAAGTSGGDAAAGTSGGDAAAGTSGTGGADGGTCPYKSSYGNVTIATNTMFAQEQVTPGNAGPAIDAVGWDGVIRNITSTPDEMQVVLTSQLTPFGDMLSPMVVDLSTQSDFQTCGACVLLSITLNADASALFTTAQTFIAVSGALNVTTLPSFPATAVSRIAGSISNAVFEHVNIDPNTGVTTKIDDCQITVTSAAFDSPVTNI